MEDVYKPIEGITAAQAGVRKGDGASLPKAVMIKNKSGLFFKLQKVENDLCIKVGSFNAVLSKLQAIELLKEIGKYINGMDLGE